MTTVIKNYTEQAVRGEVARRKDDRLSACWCDLCESDTLALAMTTLPPRYCMEQSYGLMKSRTPSGAVESAVLKAIHRVSRRPKHRLGLPDYSHQRVRVVNFALEEGNSLVRTVMMNSAVPCACYQCVSDTLAFALNRFPPLYGVECDGTTWFAPTQREFFRHDLSLVLEQAARAVAAHPHH